MTKDVAGEKGSFSGKDYQDPPPEPLFDATELGRWSFYRALIAEFIATLLFLYVTVMTVIGYKSQTDPTLNPDQCASVGVLGIAWAFGGMIFILVYCTAGISGGHINPAVTFGLFLARKVTLVRAVMYMVAQCLGAICGVALVKSFQSSYYTRYGGGANGLTHGYSIGTGVAAEIIGTFVLVYTVFSATDPKRNARDSHVPVLAPLPIGFAVFIVHLATIPITGTGINPARSLGAAIIYNKDQPWDHHLLVTMAISFLKMVLAGKLAQSKSLLSRDYAYGGLLQRHFSETAATNGCCNSSNSAAELTKAPSTSPATAYEELIVKYKSQLKINPRHDFMMVFTCKVCETRSMKMASRESYEKGVVVVRCEGCDNLHLIADRRGWFGEPGSVEEFLAAQGEEFKKGSMDSLSLTVEDLAGEKMSSE
ncbi:hypothetical protein F2Q70_00043880 [Brassica cretica]|uniref:DNL-type domain-containing protein n=3 Tax=Brassica cretica TaxID=69181 RepID=A0A8S9KKM0_BRACR|nr:hypothetical protein F2Q70_00043880 [Brassica cretica]